MAAKKEADTYDNIKVTAMLLAGDERQERLVYKWLQDYYQRVYRHILTSQKPGGPSAEQQLLVADECFDDAFLCFREKVIAGEFDPGGKASCISWFNKIAWNYFQNALRRQYGRNSTQAAVIPMHRPSADVPALNGPDGISRVLRESIENLPLPCRNYLKWHYIEGRSVAEIEQLSGNQQTTIAKNMVHCKKQLRHQLIKAYGIT